jgi:glutaminase
MPEIDRVVSEIVDEMRRRPDRGEVATYIPELARVDAKAFGLAVIDVDGRVAAAGDSEMPFSIQSISKVFTLTLALGKVGDRLWQRVGREPSGSPFNSIVQLEFERGIPRNPFINAGAIAVTDVIVSGHQPREALGEILRFMQFVADDTSITIDKAVAASEQKTGFRNIALANYMKSFGVLDNPVDFTLGVYFHHCGTLSCASRATSIDWPFGRAAGARATHQRAHAHLRSLRWLGRIRLSGRLARKEWGRRRHSRHRTGQGVDRRLVTGARRFGEFSPRPRRA